VPACAIDADADGDADAGDDGDAAQPDAAAIRVEEATEANTHANQSARAEEHGDRVEGDVDFDRLHPWQLLLGIFIIGILCKLLGIGGGELIMVVLHQLDLLPMVNSASCSVLEFSSSLSTTLQK
jgi:uncharacterized membrane protein YfcA